MSWYYDYRPTIETDEGIKAKSKRGDFVKNWWATRWIKAMEQVMDRGRLQRGRKGQVLSLEAGKGAERPYFVAQLLAGGMPPEIEEVFAAVKLDLFPGRRELHQECSCPDWADVCKHRAAVHYILGERLDEDPFLLFHLRGRSREAIVTALESVAGAGETTVAPTYTPAPPLAEALDNFWQTGPELESLTVHITAPETPYPLLERLGDPDFLPEARRWLAKAYDSVTETAVAAAYEVEDVER